MTVDGTSINDHTITITDTDAGATAGVMLDLYRNSGSETSNDELGRIDFSGQHAGPGKVAYGAITGKIFSPGIGGTGGITFKGTVNGTEYEVLEVLGNVVKLKHQGDIVLETTDSGIAL